MPENTQDHARRTGRATTTRHREIIKLLEANAGAQRLATVFDDFVQLSALAFRNDVDFHGWNECEEQYLRTAGRYSREQLDRFAEALAYVAEAMHEEPSDVLGRVYMELDLGNERLGQFFTPYDVARFMARLSLAGRNEEELHGEFLTLHEPACGAGAFIIAMTQEMRQAGLDPESQLHVTAEDISIQAVHMVYIHLAVLRVPAVVYHRNTLTRETFDAWYTPTHILGGWTAKLRRAYGAGPA